MYKQANNHFGAFIFKEDSHPFIDFLPNLVLEINLGCFDVKHAILWKFKKMLELSTDVSVEIQSSIYCYITESCYMKL